MSWTIDFGHPRCSMSMEVKAHELLTEGWREGPQFGAVLKRARELASTGLDRPGVFAALEADRSLDARESRADSREVSATHRTSASRQIGNEHNFVWRSGDSFLHGKGATPAWRDERGRPLIGLIPLNMAREILIVLGGDNDEFLSFAPHGAGRNLSRKAMLAPYRDAEGDIDPSRVKQVLAETTLDGRFFSRVDARRSGR